MALNGAALVADVATVGQGGGLAVRAANAGIRVAKAVDKANNIYETAETVVSVGNAVVTGDTAEIGRAVVSAGVEKFVGGGKGKHDVDINTHAVSAKKLDGVDPHKAPTDVKGGTHDETSKPVGDGKDSHHMPARDSNGGMPDNLAPAVKVDPVDHAETLSNGQSGQAGAEFRAQQGELWNSGDPAKMRQAMANEVKDLRNAAREGSGDATKYNEGVQEMLRKAKENEVLPGNPRR